MMAELVELDKVLAVAVAALELPVVLVEARQTVELVVPEATLYQRGRQLPELELLDITQVAVAAVPSLVLAGLAELVVVGLVETLALLLVEMVRLTLAEVAVAPTKVTVELVVQVL